MGIIGCIQKCSNHDYDNYMAVSNQTKKKIEDMYKVGSCSFSDRDKSFMIKEEGWFTNQDKILFNPDKFIEYFPNYIKEQVIHF